MQFTTYAATPKDTFSYESENDMVIPVPVLNLISSEIQNSFQGQNSFQNQVPNQNSFQSQVPNQNLFPSLGPNSFQGQCQVPSQNAFLNQNYNQNSFPCQVPSQNSFPNQGQVPNQNSFLCQVPNQNSLHGQVPNQNSFQDSYQFLVQNLSTVSVSTDNIFNELVCAIKTSSINNVLLIERYQHLFCEDNIEKLLPHSSNDVEKVLLIKACFRETINQLTKIPYYINCINNCYCKLEIIYYFGKFFNLNDLLFWFKEMETPNHQIEFLNLFKNNFECCYIICYIIPLINNSKSNEVKLLLITRLKNQLLANNTTITYDLIKTICANCDYSIWSRIIYHFKNYFLENNLMLIDFFSLMTSIESDVSKREKCKYEIVMCLNYDENFFSKESEFIKLLNCFDTYKYQCYVITEKFQIPKITFNIINFINYLSNNRYYLFKLLECILQQDLRYKSLNAKIINPNIIIFIMKELHATEIINFIKLLIKYTLMSEQQLFEILLNYSHLAQQIISYIEERSLIPIKTIGVILNGRYVKCILQNYYVLDYCPINKKITNIKFILGVSNNPKINTYITQIAIIIGQNIFQEKMLIKENNLKLLKYAIGLNIKK